MNDKAMKKYNALIEDLVSLAKESHDSRESIVCTEASEWLRHLFDKSERLSMELKSSVCNLLSSRTSFNRSSR